MKLAKIFANKHVLKKRVLLLLLNNVYLADKEYTFKIFHLLFFIFSKVDDNMYIKWIWFLLNYYNVSWVSLSGSTQCCDENKKKYVVKHTYHNLATSKNYLSKSWN